MTQVHVAGAALAGAALVLTACAGTSPPVAVPRAGTDSAQALPDPGYRVRPPHPSVPDGTVTLAFAGDVHFEAHLAGLLGRPRHALGPVERTLAAADLAMVNLESAITTRGTPEAKELEVPDQRYHFRTSPAALDVLDAAGVDVATMANNHGADFGPVGLRDSLAAIRRGPVPVVGIGRDRRAAFTPYLTSVRGTSVAFLAGDGSMREGSSDVWEAGPRNPGIAAAHADRPRALVTAVRAASRRADVVVVYLHWGEELVGCPTHQQRATAQALAEAGADVVLGSHAHVQLGAGWLGGTYVDYGLGNFVWYHDHQPRSGVLRVRVRDGRVVGDDWAPAVIGTDGLPAPLHGSARARAVADWRRLRSCTGLAAGPPRHEHPQHGSTVHARPPYVASVRPIGPALRHRMRFSHHAGCPVPLSDLRHLRMRYVGFDGRAHLGEMVVHAVHAAPVTRVFGRLYDAGFPIRRMRLVDAYRGDDDRSMAADNTSAYNCRRVAGTDTWSEHAYGAAVDVNPVENPWLHGTVDPPAGRRHAGLDRSGSGPLPAGTIGARGVVVRAFAGIGWGWGGAWSTSQDYQHFSAPRR
ncbi:CapA family protein [Nocardioides guangzhouensis]|nr:CapA family protein [Nocardioides guangzhouensis]